MNSLIPLPQTDQPAQGLLPVASPPTLPAGLIPEQPSPMDNFVTNAKFVKPGDHTYNTPLPKKQEEDFRNWVKMNDVPFDPNAKVTDYDMRGFWKAMKSGDAMAKNAIDPNDGRLHYPDYWKTPFHRTFSAESQWALPTAPVWTNTDKLISDGNVLFDDRAQR